MDQYDSLDKSLYIYITKTSNTPNMIIFLLPRENIFFIASQTITIMTQAPVTQSKKNIVMATTALSSTSSPMESITQQTNTIVKQLNYKIRSQRSMV